MARRDPRWRPYVSQYERRQGAADETRAASRRGEQWTPVRPEKRGRNLANTVWGAAWCSNLERYHDFANRLPRGRTYIRNGSVVHLEIEPGRIAARVRGSEMYAIEITISAVAAARWKAIAAACSNDIGSLVELLEGRLSASVMAVMTAPRTGLFPEPSEITMQCSCPDWATMCKHVAAVMYGVGVRLDAAPALLFALRGVDPTAMVPAVATSHRAPVDGAIEDQDLAGVFGIDLAESVPTPPRKRSKVVRGKVEPSKPVRGTASKPERGKVEPSKPARSTAERERPVAVARARRAAKTRTITRKQLIALGLSASTVSGWYDRGLLEPCGAPGVYRLTEELTKRLAARRIVVP